MFLVQRKRVDWSGMSRGSNVTSDDRMRGAPEELEVTGERLLPEILGEVRQEHMQAIVGLFRPSILMLPDRLAWPPPWVGHIPFAFYLIDVMRPRRFVELGTHSGNSFCAFLQAAAVLGAAGSYSAVDHWHGDDHSGHYEDRIFQDLRGYIRRIYGDEPNLLRMSFDEAQSRFANGSIDLLHIDGLHTYDAVKHDFVNWLPKMSDRGIVVLHDTNVREKDFGVHRLYEELSESYPTFEFLHSHGLGVVYVGTEPLHAPLRNILDPEFKSRAAIFRWGFERLGNTLSEKCFAQEQRRQAAEQQARISALETWRSEQDRELARYREEQAKVVARLNARLAGHAARAEESERNLSHSETIHKLEDLGADSRHRRDIQAGTLRHCLMAVARVLRQTSVE